MKSSWLVWAAICVLGCACGGTPAAGSSEVDTPTSAATSSPTATVAPSPSPSASPSSSVEISQSVGLAITLTTEDITPADLVAQHGPEGESTPMPVEEIPLQATPILSQDDIVMYDGASHAFTLTPEAVERLTGSLFALAGPPFVVTVDGDPIYAGSFWSPLSSQSFDGVVIMVMPDGTPFNGVAADDVYQISLGYPGSDLFRGEDPRSDSRILDALDAAGKLK